MLQAQSSRPDPRLTPFVRTYVQRTAVLGDITLTEPVLARLGVMMEFAFKDQYDVRSYGTDQRNQSAYAALVGPISYRRARLVIRGNIESLVIMFQPAGFHMLFGESTAPFAEQGFDVTTILGSRVWNLYQRLGNERSFAARVDLLNAWLLEQLARLRRADPAWKVLQRLAAPGPFLPVHEAARQSGLSVRQLERKALTVAGVSPKAMTQIARFQRALGMKSQGHRTWIEVAHAAEYHDQMHMVRDFRVFAGATPNEVLGQLAPEHLIHFAAPKSAHAAQD